MDESEEAVRIAEAPRGLGARVRTFSRAGFRLDPLPDGPAVCLQGRSRIPDVTRPLGPGSSSWSASFSPLIPSVERQRARAPADASKATLTGEWGAWKAYPQLAGDFAFYFVEPPNEEDEGRFGEMEELLMLGFHAGLVDGDAFLEAFEKLLEVGSLGSIFELEEMAGVDVYLADEDDDFDGGVAFLPRAFTAAPSRRVLERGLQALTRADGASVLHGSRMQAAIDENAGVCFLWCVEMTPLRVFLLPELKGDLSLPPLEEGQPARDPFDAQLVSTVRRTRDGFELRLHTR